MESPSGTRASKISSGKSNQDRDELVEFLDRLSVRNAQAALQLLEQRFHQEALDLERCNSLLFRYFERLIAQKPSAALGYDEYIPRMLGENDLRTEWIRKIARGLIKEDPSYLNTLAPHHLAKLEPEDWLPLVQSVRNWPAIANTLLRIPSAVAHPPAREYVFQYGSRSNAVALLEQITPTPEEAPLAARAILRVAKWDFDELFDRWPALKAALAHTDLLPFLESKDALIRQKAIMLLGGVRNATPERAPEMDDPGQCPATFRNGVV